MTILLHQLGILPILYLPLLSLLEVHEGVCFLLGLPLHQEHSSLVCLFYLFCKLLLLYLLQLSFLFLLLLVLVYRFSLCLSNSLLFKVSFLFLFSPLVLLLLGKLLPRSHNHILLAVYGIFKLLFFLYVGLPPAFFLLFLFFPHVPELLLKLIQRHFLKKSNRNKLNFLLRPSSNFFL